VTSFRETLLLGCADAGRTPARAEGAASSPEAAELEAAIAGALETARHAWPSLPLDPQLFVRHLGRNVASYGPDVPLRAALADCHVADLFLACAAGHGVVAAVEIVAGRALDGVTGAVRKVRGTDSSVDDVMQIVRQKLFVRSEDSEPKILSYSARAPLGVWLAVVAQKAALSFQRAASTQAELKARFAAEADVAALEPELRYLKTRYAGQFEEAFKHALGRLSERGRALLRLHCFRGMTLHQLAGMYGVDDATISRWLAKARSELLDETGRYMREAHGISAQEFPSLARVLTSQLETSMARLLADP
jgi:RNA polymerase sigma-70 factor (ECF subfamily)